MPPKEYTQWWLIRGIIPKWPYCSLVNYHDSSFIQVVIPSLIIPHMTCPHSMVLDIYIHIYIYVNPLFYHGFWVGWDSNLLNFTSQQVFFSAGMVFDKSGPGASPRFTPVAAPASKNSPAQLWDCECLRNPGETVEILCGTSLWSSIDQITGDHWFEWYWRRHWYHRSRGL